MPVLGSALGLVLGDSVGSPAPSPPFSFTDIPNSVYWVDPNDASTYTDGSAISDKSELGGILTTQSTESQEPTMGTRQRFGRTLADFDDADNQFWTTSTTTMGSTTMFCDEGQEFTVYSVAIYDDNTGYSIGKSGATNANRQFGFFIDPNSDTVVLRARGNGTSTPAFQMGQYVVVMAVWDGTDLTLSYMTEGQSTFTDIPGSVGTAVEETDQDIILGARTNGTAFFLDGALGDQVVYDRAITSAEKANIETFTAQTYTNNTIQESGDFTEPENLRIFQRSTTTGGEANRGEGAIDYAFNLSTSSDVYARVRDASTGAIVKDTFLVQANVPTGAQTLSVTVPAREGYFYVDFSSGADSPFAHSQNMIGMGRVIACAGQSQMVRQFVRISSVDPNTNATLGITPNPNSAVFARYTDSAVPNVTSPVWTIPADGTAYDSTFASDFLDKQVNHFGVNCALVGHSIGSTTIATWLTGQTNNNDLAAVLDAVGGFECFMWYQGGSDASAGTPQATYEAGLTDIIDGIANNNAVLGSNFDKIISTMYTRLSGAGGTFDTIHAIRNAGKTWAAANDAEYLEAHDTVLADNLHQNNVGNLAASLQTHRATLYQSGAPNDNTGAIVTGGSLSGVEITLNVSLTSGATTLVQVGDASTRFAIFNAGTTTSPLALAGTNPITVGADTITLRLASAPAGAIDVYPLGHPDPSGTTPADNIIYDDNTADGFAVGRQLEASVTPINIT